MIRRHFPHFPAVYGMLLPQGFIRRKGFLAPRIDRQAQNCYKTFKIGRNKVICRPNEAMLDGQNPPSFIGILKMVFCVYFRKPSAIIFLLFLTSVVWYIYFSLAETHHGPSRPLDWF